MWVPGKKVVFARVSNLARRYLSCCAALLGSIEIFIGLFGYPILVYVLLSTSYYLVTLMYLAWLIYDRKTPEQGGRRCGAIRRLRIWNWAANYFPIKLIKTKTHELDPSTNYIFGYHPHGMISVGAILGFGTEAVGFSKTFPGLTPHVVTHGWGFWFPYARDCLLARGHISSSVKSMNWVLQSCGTGNVLVLVIGGGREMLDTDPGVMKLTLKNRKGFLRIGLANGASLVPVLAFGENCLFKPARLDSQSQSQSPLHKLCPTTLYQLVALILSIFTLPWIINFPARQPVFIVVGSPIPLPCIENPPESVVNKYHLIYMRALEELFEENKWKYAADPDKLHLEFQ